MAGLADLFSGGENSKAADILSGQLNNLNNLPTPSAAQLTLPELQKYVSAGILTPEQAQAYLVNGNAFDTTSANNSGMQTEQDTIGRLRDIVNQGGNDAEEKANIQGILNTLGTTESGNNEAIMRDAQARGVGNSGTTLAARLASNQNDATNANSNAMNAAALAEQRQLGALSSAGTLGGQVQGQQYTADANRANAANAIAQFNAQQQQQVGNLNTTTTNEAKATNLANAQDIANKNTGSAQEQERSIPAAQQQAYQDALEKASAGMAGAENLANVHSQTGQQNAGILGGLVGTAGTVGAAYLTGNPYAALATQLAKNNTGGAVNSGAIPNTNISNDANAGSGAASGGEITMNGVARPLDMKSGGPVPGMPMVPGDSPQNDTVPARLSPGEIVLPRSVTQPAPEPSKVLQFLQSLPKPQAKPAVHPRAVLDTLRALNLHHSGAM